MRLHSIAHISSHTFRQDVCSLESIQRRNPNNEHREVVVNISLKNQLLEHVKPQVDVNTPIIHQAKALIHHDIEKR